MQGNGNRTEGVLSKIKNYRSSTKTHDVLGFCYYWKLSSLTYFVEFSRSWTADFHRSTRCRNAARDRLEVTQSQAAEVHLRRLGSGREAAGGVWQPTLLFLDVLLVLRSQRYSPRPRIERLLRTLGQRVFIAVPSSERGFAQVVPASVGPSVEEPFRAFAGIKARCGRGGL